MSRTTSTELIVSKFWVGACAALAEGIGTGKRTIREAASKRVLKNMTGLLGMGWIIV
jgi:hypothetical protein